MVEFNFTRHKIVPPATVHTTLIKYRICILKFHFGFLFEDPLRLLNYLLIILFFLLVHGLAFGPGLAGIHIIKTFTTRISTVFDGKDLLIKVNEGLKVRRTSIEFFCRHILAAYQQFHLGVDLGVSSKMERIVHCLLLILFFFINNQPLPFLIIHILLTFSSCFFVL